MKKITAAIRLIALISMASAAAHAASLLDITSAVALGDPTQQGRLSRNGIAQDWTGGEPFPGVINTGVTYHYTTFSLNVGVNSFIQIEFDDIAGLGQTFASAYDGSYAPNSAGSPNFGFNTNFLGDDGSSGNSFGTDPKFFQVVVPLNDTLVVVINNANPTNGGVGDSFRLIVDGFIDTSFDDAPTPEPSAVFLVGGGLILLALCRRKYGQSGY